MFRTYIDFFFLMKNGHFIYVALILVFVQVTY